MTLVRVKGLKKYRDRHGQWRCYIRKTRQTIDLVKFPFGTPEFLAEVERLGRQSAIGIASTKPGTLGLLISRYKESDEFKALRRRTKDDYVRCLDYLDGVSDQPLLWFRRHIVVRIRNKAAKDMGRKWGNYVKTVLSLLFGWACENGYMETNPAHRVKGIKKPKNAPEANRPWSDAEREAVYAEAKPAMRVNFALMMYCGLDPQDAVALPKTAIRNGMLNTKRGKTSTPVWAPLPQPVIEALAAQPEHSATTAAVKADGTPWTKSGFDSAWQPLKAKLLKEGKIEPGLTLKGLRHTVGTILAEMGFDDRTIADMLGHETLTSARIYSKRANRTKKMRGVVADFNEELRKRNAK